MPQLPLKTVLAYLDDALEAKPLREVAEKIAHSPELQQLIARIQQLVRSRDLVEEADTEEPPVPAELLAQYLEGTLSPEQAEEFERQCLQKDSLLAEVASCHQLVQAGVRWDASRISPSAFQRMYNLLEGAQRTVKPTALLRTSETPEEPMALRPEEQTLLLGLPLMLRGPWKNRLAPIGVILVLLCGLFISLYFALTRSGRGGPASSELAASSTVQPPEKPAPSATKVPQPPPLRRDLDEKQRITLALSLVLLPRFLGASPAPPNFFTAHGREIATAFFLEELRSSVVRSLILLPDFVGAGPAPSSFLMPLLGKIAAAIPVPPPAQAELPIPVLEDLLPPKGTERLPKECMPRDVAELFGKVSKPVSDNRPLGTCILPDETLFWIWSADGKQAGLLKAHDRLFAGSRVQVWPGYRASIRFDSGIELELVGNVPDLYAQPTLDTACRLYSPQPPYHMEILLERGWFVIRGLKDQPCQVRLRLAGEVWDLFLPAGAPRMFVSYQRRLQCGEEGISSRTIRELWTLESGVLWRRTLSGEKALVYPVFSRSRVLADDFDPDSQKPIVIPAPMPPSWSDKPAKLSAALREALENFQRLVYQRSVLENPMQHLAGARQALQEELDSGKPVEARLAIFGLAVCDKSHELVQVLDNRTQPDIRRSAREALHYWLAQDPSREEDLRKRVLDELRYTPEQADRLLSLLRGYSRPRPDVAKELLTIMEDVEGKNRPALRYLAWENLRELYRNLRDPGYSPNAPREARENAVEAIRKQLR